MNNERIHISEEIKDSLSSNKPIVALETTIISHGLPYPDNIKTSILIEKSIRNEGAIPATIGIVNGKIIVGLNNDEISILASESSNVIKTSRRDIPFILSKNRNGATTVAGTIFLAEKVGIKVMATGGIGGVHRNAEKTFDVSADLLELSKSKISIVCSGPKSILDISLTKEYLETVSVPIIGYNSKTIPTFFTKDSEFDVDFNYETINEIVSALKLKDDLESLGGTLICNPINEKYSIPFNVIEKVILKSLKNCEIQNIKGKDVTPFILNDVLKLTEGKSLKANIDLINSNSKLAAKIATKLY